MPAKCKTTGKLFNVEQLKGNKRMTEVVSGDKKPEVRLCSDKEFPQLYVDSSVGSVVTTPVAPVAPPAPAVKPPGIVIPGKKN